MKLKDVVIGECYETKVCGVLVKVRVTGEGYSYSGGVKRFKCSRVDNGKELSKSRTAASLRPVRVG